MREKKRIKCPECGRWTVEVTTYADGSRLYVHSKKLMAGGPIPMWDATDSCFRMARKEDQ